MSSPEHVIILGAGPGGLACAHELTRHGVPCTVLERNDYVGGLCRTVEYNGYRFDLGGHRWFTKNVDLHRWFLSLMEGELVEVERISRIFHDNKYFDYPITVTDVLRNSSLREIAVIMFGFLQSAVHAAFHRRAPRNMEEAYVAQFGRPLYEKFFRTYSEKVWGRSCNMLSADWVAQRSAGLSVKDLVKNALLRSDKKNESLIDRFVYPRLGYARIPERLAEEVQAAGSEVRLNASVARIQQLRPGAFDVFYSHRGKDAKLHGDAVVSTIPLSHLVTMMKPEPEPGTITCAKGLEFRDLITVTIMLNTPRVTRDSWVYVQDRDIVFARLHEPGNWSRDLVPDSEHTSLVMECFCSRDDQLWRQSDEQLIERCVSDLADKLNFVERRHVVDAVVVRTANAYPIYDLEYGEKLERIKASLAAYEGLHMIGRGGTFRYNNADHSIEMGLLLAQKLTGSTVNHMAVNTEQEYQEVRGSRGLQRDQYVVNS